MISAFPSSKTIPLDIVGGNTFGRYPIISAAQTWNMYISDNWLISFPGYEKAIEIEDVGVGRGLFASYVYNKMISVIDDSVYEINTNLNYRKIGRLETLSSDVFIAENNGGQIALCDQKYIYIFDHRNQTFTKVDTDFTPGYVSFQDGYFIAPEIGEAKWRLSSLNNGSAWPANPENVGEFQTKPDTVVACIPVSGKQNHLLIMGRTVCELWIDVGGQIFPYERAGGFTIDYGVVNVNTIASLDNIIVWLGSNEKSGLAILHSNGGNINQISTEGITSKLEEIVNKQESYGFLVKIEGHLIYIITFSGRHDQITYAYDFSTKQFFSLSDEHMCNFIAKKAVYFAGKYYFVSFSDGNLYELSTSFSTYDGNEIPRVRVCNTVKLPNTKPFILNNLNFPIEQGRSNLTQRIDLTVSRDAGVTYGNSYSTTLNTKSYRLGRFELWNLGYGNYFTPQFRFWGFDRFVAQNGTMEYHL